MQSTDDNLKKNIDRCTGHRHVTEVMLKTSINRSIYRCVRGREVERRPCNHEVPSSSPGSGSQPWDLSLAHTFRREYWCSSQEAESREISISCKNLFLNHMFKLN